MLFDFESQTTELLTDISDAEYKYTLAFLGYGPEESSTVFELTYNWDRDTPYSKGTAYAQVRIPRSVQ